MNISSTQTKLGKTGIFIRTMVGIGSAGLMLLTMVCSKPEQKSQSPPEPVTSPEKIIGIGRIEPEKRIVNLSSEVAGIISEIRKAPGSRVKKGEVILSQINAIEKARVNQARSRIKVQQSQIAAAEAALNAARAKLTSTRNNYERLKKLYAKKAKPEAQYEKAQADYHTLMAEINRSEANLRAAHFLLDQYRADLNRTEAELARKSIAAPADGQILSIDIPAGSYISPGQSVGSFAPESPLTAWCEIDELFADLVEINQEAIIRYPGRTEKLAQGRVTYAGPWLRKKSIFSDDIGDLEDRRVREVWIRLDSGSGVLLGSRVECVIFLEK